MMGAFAAHAQTKPAEKTPEKKGEVPAVTIKRNVSCSSLKIGPEMFGKPSISTGKAPNTGNVTARIGATNRDEYASTLTFTPKGLPNDVIIEAQWSAKLVWGGRKYPIRTERGGTFVWFGPKDTPVVIQYTHGPYYTLEDFQFTRMACHHIEPDPCPEPEDEDKEKDEAKKPAAVKAQAKPEEPVQPQPPTAPVILPGEFD